MSLKSEFRKLINRFPGTESLVARWDDREFIRSLNRPANDLQWEPGPRAPQKCVESARLQLGDELFMIGGYISLDRVSNRIEVFDFRKNKWTRGGQLPEGLPQTHNGTTTDGIGTIFSVGGQLGANCSPASPNCFSLNPKTLTWHPLPQLPEPRYMPLVHFHNGRIHSLAGSMPDRVTSSVDHWSLKISQGRAAEDTWRRDAPLPQGRTHTASHLIGDTLYVLGGQQGDVPSIPGSADHVCNFNSPMDVVFDEAFTFDLVTDQVRQLPPLPHKVSHTEHAVFQVGSKIVIAGGVLDRMTLSGLIIAFDLKSQTWETVGQLPYPMKSKIAVAWKDWIYVLCGQKSVSDTDLRPHQVLNSVWRAKLPPQWKLATD